MASTTQPVIEHVEPHGPAVRPYELSWATIVVVSIAGTKAGLALLLATPLAPVFYDPSQLVGQVAVRDIAWLLPGLVLLLANSRQCRTGSLGVAMILAASRATGGVIPLITDAAPIASFLLYTAPAFLTPYYFGRFLLDFPQPRTGRSARWLWAATRLAAALGTVQLMLHFVRPLVEELNPPRLYLFAVGAIDARVVPFTTYSVLVLVLGLSFVGFRGLLPEDRRRHSRLLIGWASVIVPLSVWVVQLMLSGPDLHALGTAPHWLRLVTVALNFTWTVAPTVVAYYVLEGQSRHVREALQRATLILLNARVLTAAAIGPVMAMIIAAYRQQDHTVSEVFSRTAIAWLAVALASTVLLLRRRALLRAFNRWFFREHQDADAMVFAVTSRIRKSNSIDELAAALREGVDRLVRPYRVVVLVRDESATQFVPLSGSAEPLPSSALLADLLRAGRGVLDTPLAGGTSPMRWLPQDERYWLVDCGARLVVPLHGSDGSLNGLIAVGDRRSGRPYTDEDRRTLTSLAESATLTIEAHSTTGASQGTAPPWRVGLVQRYVRALECERCGQIVEAGATSCPQCGDPLSPSLVPHLLSGKFRFEQRIGRGGMGVVFRATDLALERAVAVKMLPGATPEYSELLRHEARAMAAVTHRHLAVIYSVEAWRGQPLLVCEYMAHGTLADRLAQGGIQIDEVLAIGVSLAEALDVIHARQLLHRDIKPSNIGFDHARVPKLLDFGLAHIAGAGRLAEELRPAARTAGTPLYMSPEAIAGVAASPAGDLWGLHVMLHEAISGRHPFRRHTTEATLEAIINDTAPSLTDTMNVPNVPHISADRAARIASYFARALSKTVHERPQSAGETASALRSLLA